MRRTRVRLLLLAAAAVGTSACRTGYELLGGPPGIGLGGESSGGQANVGGGSSGGRTGSDGGSPSGGTSSGGNTSSSGGKSSSGGAPTTGGSPGLGGSSTGGAASGGAPSGGSSSGGASSGGGLSSGGAGSGGGASGGADGGTGGRVDYSVTTADDEEDVGATTADPLGTGLSLREAILLSNQTPGPQTIRVEASPIVLTSLLPFLTDSAKVDGAGGTLDASTIGASYCLRAGPETYTITNWTLVGCGDGIYLDGSSGVVSNNRVLDVTRWGLYGGGVNSLVIGNLFVRTQGITSPPSASGNRYWFNTFVDTQAIALNVGQSTGNDVRNNVITGSGQFGVSGPCSKFTSLDHNLFFNNVSGDTNGCASTSSVSADPLYSNPGADDYTLGLGSPAIDAGADLGEDRNQGASGLFNGASPDLGYSEAP